MTDTPEKLVQTIRRKTRKKHHPEEKIRIVLEGLLLIDFENPNRLRIQGEAELSRDPELIDLYKEAELVVKVTVDKLFQNCPRYIHRYQRLSQSPYVPKDEQDTPMAGWKRIDIIQDVLKEEEREKVKASGGTMPIEEWMEKVETGAEDA